MGRRSSLLLAMVGCISGLGGQNTFLQSLDASAMPDTARIDRINDDAYAFVKAKPESAAATQYQFSRLATQDANGQTVEYSRIVEQ